MIGRAASHSLPTIPTTRHHIDKSVDDKLIKAHLQIFLLRFVAIALLFSTTSGVPNDAMRASLGLAFLIVNAVCDDSGVSEQDEARRRILERLSNIQTVVLENYELVTRISATAVFHYRSYRNVAVLFYPLPQDVLEARFTFQAENVHLNTIGSCDPVEVTVHLKQGAYPVVNPDGYPLPSSFTYMDREMYTLSLISDAANTTFTVHSPQAGEWYGIAYLPWQDPRTQKVEQQGLFADCQTVLYTDVQVRRARAMQADCSQPLLVSLDDGAALYKCMSPATVTPLTLRLGAATDERHRAVVRVQAAALPGDAHLLQCAFTLADNPTRVSFTPHPSAWHYIAVEAEGAQTSNVADCESYADPPPDEGASHVVTEELARDSKGMFFSYDYALPSSDLQETLSVVNLTAGEVRVLKFTVNPIVDIGGTMSVAASLLMPLKYYVGFKRQFATATLMEFSDADPFFKVVVCLSRGHAATPTRAGQCRYNDRLAAALFVINSTDSGTIDDSVLIPYPEAGAWYLSMRVICADAACPCRLVANTTRYLLEWDDAKAHDYTEENRGAEGVTEGASTCNASVMVSVGSMPCVGGRCGARGTCVFTTSGGLVLSSCACRTGWGGWDCADSSRMQPYGAQLASVLLLTLSNLLFLASVAVAAARRYVAESVMYAFTMAASALYHACDAPATVAYCVASHGLLQFADFYCGIMSFWVTLLAVTVVGAGARASLQLVGAVGIALLTTWNMQSLAAFALPVALGAALALASWFVDHRRRGTWPFSRSYYTRSLPVGLALVGTGLACFAFLQTEQNYKYVHSAWHAIIALSVVCLLPEKGEGSWLPARVRKLLARP